MSAHQITLYAPDELLRHPETLADKLANALCFVPSAHRVFARYDNYWVIDDRNDVRVQFEPKRGIIRIITRYRYRLKLIRQNLKKVLADLGCREVIPLSSVG